MEIKSKKQNTAILFFGEVVKRLLVINFYISINICELSNVHMIICRGSLCIDSNFFATISIEKSCCDINSFSQCSTGR